jgi:hypothetical protein
MRFCRFTFQREAAWMLLLNTLPLALGIAIAIVIYIAKMFD